MITEVDSSMLMKLSRSLKQYVMNNDMTLNNEYIQLNNN